MICDYDFYGDMGFTTGIIEVIYLQIDLNYEYVCKYKLKCDHLLMNF